MLYAITASSKHPMQAAKFINYLLNEPQAAMRIKNTRGVLLNTKLSKQLTETGLSSPLVQQMVEQALSGKSKSESSYSLGSEVSNLIWTYIHHVGFGELSAEDAANQFLKDLQFLFA
jgi:oligogalacturonide transport system substrate-binding protein